MSDLERWLSGGDLTSDGAADQVVEFVSQHPELLPDLVAGLNSDDDVVRGRAADALEKVARSQPDEIVDYIDLFLARAVEDKTPMVRWHLAMLLGHLSHYRYLNERILTTLLKMLQDDSVFTQSWAMVSLCLIVRQYPQFGDEVIPKIASLAKSPSAAIQTKVRKCMPLLMNPETPFPKGWIKSVHLGDI
jgi:hypothetical protein